MLFTFFKNDIIFSDREFFFKHPINFIPTKDNPRPEDEEKKSNNKTQNSWIKEYSDTQYETKCSKENHRRLL